MCICAAKAKIGSFTQKEKKKKKFGKKKAKAKIASFTFIMFGFKVICWALLFIFKLRFPPGVSIAIILYTTREADKKRMLSNFLCLGIFVSKNFLCLFVQKA